MACLCGDTQCWSCGPAQGNWKCPICHAWADDGCAHLDEDTGDLKPEFAEAAEAAAFAERESEAAMAAEYAEICAAAERWKKSGNHASR